LPPVVKHAWDRGQPAPGIGAMTAPHAGRRAEERTVVLHCAKMRGAVAARHFIAGVGRCGEITCLLNFLALLPRLLGLYL
jgi:hypothetical protein